jgi:hypothetical protein
MCKNTKFTYCSSPTEEIRTSKIKPESVQASSKKKKRRKEKEGRK